MKSHLQRARRIHAPARVVVAALLVACGGADGTSPPNGGTSKPLPGVRFITGIGLTDTIGARPSQGLTIRVIMPDGTTKSGVVVQVSPPIASFGGSPLLVALGSKPPISGIPVADTTNAAGQVDVHVALGNKVGTFMLRAAVAALGYVDSTTVSITPGAAAHIAVSPKDTVGLVGATIPLRATTTDRAGNVRSDAPTYSVVSGPASPNGTASVSLSAVGLVRAVAQVGTVADTATIRAAPQGMIAACQCPPFLNGDRLVVTTKLDGSAMTHLAKSPMPSSFGEMPPSWSPDGRQIAYSDRVLPDGDYHLFIVDTVGNTRRLVFGAGGPIQEARPSWSRAGDWIYFQGWLTHQDPVLWRVRPDGSSVEQLTFNPQSTFSDFDAAVSPDGSRVAYSTNREGDNTYGNLRVLDVATRAAVSLRLRGIRPAWSPDGNWIAFLLPDDGGQQQLAIVHPDGTGLRTLGASGYTHFYERPMWTKDSKYLLATAPVERFVVVDIATSAIMELPFAKDLTAASWRP